MGLSGFHVKAGELGVAQNGELLEPLILSVYSGHFAKVLVGSKCLAPLPGVFLSLESHLFHPKDSS